MKKLGAKCCPGCRRNEAETIIDYRNLEIESERLLWIKRWRKKTFCLVQHGKFSPHSTSFAAPSNISYKKGLHGLREEPISEETDITQPSTDQDQLSTVLQADAFETRAPQASYLSQTWRTSYRYQSLLCIFPYNRYSFRKYCPWIIKYPNPVIP